MRLCRPCRFLLVLVLVGVAAWPPPLPAPWGGWLLPGLAVLGALMALFSRPLPLRFWGAAAALLGLLAVYAWNPTHRWERDAGLLPLEHISGLPGSAFPSGTWEAVALAAGLLAAFALAARLSERQIRALQIAAVAGAAAMALVVLFQRLEPNRPRIFPYTGIFVNENHFAVFANLLMPVVLAQASRARFRSVLEATASSPAGLYGLVAALLGGAVVLSRSRAGVLVLLVVISMHAWRHYRLVRPYPFLSTRHLPGLRRLGLAAVLAATAAAAIALLAYEWTHPEDVAREWAFRSGILIDTLRAWRDSPVWGTGPGSFAAVFPYYASEMFRHRVILHAHCEPVQFLLEFGWAGSLWMVVAAGVALSCSPPRNGARANGELPPLADLERPAFALGLVALGLHALVDFPLRIPLLALLAAIWAGAWVGLRPAALSALPPEPGGT